MAKRQPSTSSVPTQTGRIIPFRSMPENQAASSSQSNPSASDPAKEGVLLQFPWGNRPELAIQEAQ